MAYRNSTDVGAGWPSGFFIGTREHVPTIAQITAYFGRPVAMIGDCLGRSLGTIGLKAYHAPLSLTMCGPALTVRVRPGDNLMIHKALELAKPGDVLVIDGGGDLSQAVIGGLMRTTALAAQLGGIVLDGALRDVVEWGDERLPVFAKGHTHRGPSKTGPGEINVPVACAGMTVSPGDLVLGDADGVIAVPIEQLDALLPRVVEHEKREAAIREANANRRSDPERFNAILRAHGCPV
jgi:regulator of RNase E activity RraA